MRKLLLAGVLVLGTASDADAQFDAGTGWYGQTELGYVATGGNSDTESLQLEILANLDSERGDFGLEAGGFQAQTTSFLRFAERSESGELVLVEEASTSLSAENYWIRAHFRRSIGSGDFFGFGRLEWDRDEPAEIRNRYSGILGVGKDWIDSPKTTFWTEYGLTINRERRNVVGLERAVDFPGVRFQWQYRWKATRTSWYRNDLTVNQNMQDTEDLRAVMRQKLEIGLTDRFFVVLGLELKYDDDPAFERIRIRGSQDFLRLPKDKLDRKFTTSLAFRY